MKIDMGYSWNVSDIDAGVPRVPCGILYGQNVVLGVSVTVKDDVVPDLRNVKSPIHLGFVVARYRIEPRTCEADEAPNEVLRGEWVSTPRSTNHCSSSESNFQKWEQFGVDLLPVHKRIRDVRMSFKASKELVNTNRADVAKKAGQKKW